MDEQERQETLVAALDQLPFPVAVAEGADQRLVAINALGRSLAGDGHLGAPLADWVDLLGPELIERCKETWRTATPYAGDEWRFELAGPDGGTVEHFFSFQILPVVRGDGSIRALVGVGQDVTEQVQARQQSARPEPIMEAEEQDRLVSRLQDALLPTGLPAPQGVELAARYLFGESDTVGGDWFDAVPLPDGKVAVVVGDVVGGGIEASVAMGELKALFEERVRQDGDLVAAVQMLDARASRVEEARSTTLCAGVFDPATGVLEYLTAGHPPPLLVTAGGGSEYLAPSGAGPLASGLPLESARQVLAEGDLVLLYSDGLVARPGGTPAQHTVDLLQVAGESVRGTGAWGVHAGETVAEQVCRQVLEVVAGRSGHADDATVLALRVVPRVEPLQLQLPAVPDAVRTARADVDDWLAALRISVLDHMALLHAAGELVGNAVQHAYPSVHVHNAVRVCLRLSPEGVVELDVDDDGEWRVPPTAAPGRGLATVAGFLDDLDLRLGPAGTRVHACYRVSRPATLLRGRPADRPGPDRTFALAVVGDVVHVVGALDLRSADELRRAIMRASMGGTRPVTVGLEEVDLLSSAAVQVIYEARSSGPVHLVAPQGSPAQHVLDLVRLPHSA